MTIDQMRRWFWIVGLSLLGACNKGSQAKMSGSSQQVETAKAPAVVSTDTPLESILSSDIPPAPLIVDPPVVSPPESNAENPPVVAAEGTDGLKEGLNLSGGPTNPPSETIPPTISSGDLIFSNVTSSGFTVNWTGATASATTKAGSTLTYVVYYSTADSTVLPATSIQAGTSTGSSLSIVGLNPATIYHVNVLVSDGVGPAAAYTAHPVLTVPSLTAGTLSVSGITSGGFTANWTVATESVPAPTGAAALTYKVYYSSTQADVESMPAIVSAGTGVTEVLPPAGVTSLAVTGLNPSTTYYVNVVASDGLVNNAVLYKAIDVPTNALATPGAFAAPGISTPTDVTLTWTPASEDSHLVALQYQVYYSTSNNVDTAENAIANGTSVFTTPQLNITTAGIAGLAPNTTYFVNVLVSDGGGAQVAYQSTQVKTAQLPDTTPPALPAGGNLFLSDVTSSSFTVTWNPATDSGSQSGPLQYVVFYSRTDSNAAAANSLQAIPDPGKTTVTLTGLNPMTRYFVNVRVSDDAGNSTDYIVNSTGTANSLTPGSLSSSEITSGGFTVNWTAAGDTAPTQGGPITYKVFANTTTTVGAGQTSLAITGLTPSTTYPVKVVASDQSQQTITYPAISITTNTLPTPGTLTIGTPTSVSLPLSWTAASESPSTPPLFYQVYYSTSNNITTASTAQQNGKAVFASPQTDTAATITGLTPNTKYFVNVLVSDGVGAMVAYSSTSATTAVSVAGNSGTTLLVSNTTSGGFTVSWPTATDAAGGTVAYTVYYSTVSVANVASAAAAADSVLAGTAVQQPILSGQSSTLNNLTANTTYYVNVVASADSIAGNALAYTVQAVRTNPLPIPATVTLSAPTTGGLTVSWGSALPITTTWQYLVYYSTSSTMNPKTVVNSVPQSTLTPVTIAGLTSSTPAGLLPTTKYYVQVEVSDGVGLPVGSAIQNATTAGSLSSSTGTALSFSAVTRSGFTVTWPTATDATGGAVTYAVYASTSNVGLTSGTPVATNLVGNSFSPASLVAGTTYYVNVVASDGIAGNTLAYTASSQKTLAITPGTLVLSYGSISKTDATGTFSLHLSWTTAIGGTAPLTYKVYYSSVGYTSATNTLMTPQPCTYTGAIGSAVVSGLPQQTALWIQVVVTDNAVPPNQASYTAQQFRGPMMQF